MASTDPITGARIGDMNDGPLGGLYLAQIITDLRDKALPRFTTQSARDAAYAAAGVTVKNGMSCWTDDAGFWDRTGGAWVLRTSPARLRLTATDDASLTSTLHAFQIGPDNGLNMVIDQNEIIARSNGSASPLYLDNCSVVTVPAPTSGAHAATKSYVDGSSGTLSIFAGWTAYSGYHTPSWTLSPSGIVTLSGMVQRTGASFALGTGSPFQFATLPASLVPTAIVSPICYAGLGASVGTYPARAYVAANSTNLSLVGMDSGTGTMTQTVGFINLDGVTFHV